MRIRNVELELAYRQETGNNPAVEGVWIDAKVKKDWFENCFVEIQCDQFPKKTMDGISQRGGFSIPDVDYLVWLENKLTEKKL